MAHNESYEEFVDKFKPKLTTDDCYTPPAVYEAVADWAASEYGADIIRQAEREKAEREKAERWKLSEEEQRIIESLG